MTHQPLPIIVAILLSPALTGCYEPRTSSVQPPPVTNRFTRLGADYTGLDFTIQWDKPARFDRVFYSQNTGGGVAIGDVDGDGLADIYLTRPSGGNRLYRNLGDLRFADVTQSAGLLDESFWGTGASFVDLNGDGLLDLYACGYACPNRLYINQGRGRFREMATAYGLDYNGASVMMAFADMDRDGDLDGYLVTAGLPPGPHQQFRVRFEGNRPVVLEELQEFWQLLYLPGDRAKQVEAGQFDHLFRNDGPNEDGQVRFTNVSREAGIDGTDLGQAATWWDYNADGYPDLYVANDYWGSDKLYRNRGNGTFEDVAKSVLPHTPWSSMGTDLADINGDGRIDFIATDMAGSTHFKQKVGMGDMASAGWFLEYAEPRQYSRNTVFINSGVGRMMEAAYLTGLANSDWTWTPRFDDFDNDGRVDLLITNGMTRDFTNSDLNNLAKSKYKEGSPEFFRFWREQDFRRDHNLMYRNAGDLRFEDVSKQWGFDRLGVSFGAATGDLDQDGDLDVVVNNMDTTVMVYRNDLPAGNHVRLNLQGTRSNRLGLGALVKIQTGTHTQAQYHTLSRGWTSTSEPIVHFGIGKHTQVDQVTIEWPSGVVQHLQALAANKTHTVIEPESSEPIAPRQTPRSTLFVASADFGRLNLTHQETPYDDFKRQPLLPNKLSQLGPGIACADLNQDGVDDFYLAGAAHQPGQLLVSQTGGGYAQESSPAFVADQVHEDMGALFLDYDADGDFDLYVASGGSEFSPNSSLLTDRLYVNEGRGRFARARDAIPDYRISSSAVVAADFDRDGDLDLYVGGRQTPGNYPVAPESVLLVNRDGIYVDATDEHAASLRQPGMVTGAIWSDVDNDGWLDLLVCLEWGPVRLFRNQQGVLSEMTSEAGLADHLGWWNAIHGGDFDHDGDIDFVVSNFGLNTKYHASKRHPTRIYFGDFAGLGLNRIVESEYEGEKLFPVRGKSCSTNAMPFLGDKFKTFAEFGIAELDDIYTPQALEKAEVFEANTLDTGLLVNDGHGQFNFRPLARIAQIAPTFGSAVTDVDGDGHLDIYLVQNFYSPQRETGHMDGGVSLLMRGDGQGSFAPVWPDDSGLVVPADGKCVAVTDLNADGADDFVVGMNNGEWLAFENAIANDQGRFVVELQGPAGNPTGIGARAVLVQDDGRRQVRELAAGAGYLSQSTSRLSFGIPPNVQSASIRIRWPDGLQTEHALTPRERRLTIAHPDR